MLSGAGSWAPILVSAITRYTAGLVDLGYTPINISSMLNGVGSQAHMVVEAILKSTAGLVDLGYTPTNISSMLSAAGRAVFIAIPAITRHTPELIDLGYTPTNISSILNGGARAIPLIINAIIDNTPQLIGLGYSAKNISSMLGSAGGSIASAISAVLGCTQPLLDLGISHTNISGYLFDKPCAKYSMHLGSMLMLSSQVLKLGYSQSDLRRLFYERVPSCQRAIDLMRSIIDTHDSFSTFSIYTPCHLVEMATSEGQDFDAKFFVTCLHAARAARTSGTVCSARQTRPIPDASHVDALSRPRSIEMGQDRARI